MDTTFADTDAEFVADALRPKTFTINGKAVTLNVDEQGNPFHKTRLTWTEIARLSGKKNTNLLIIMYTAPDEDRKQLIFSSSLIIVDGMTIEVS